VTTNVPTVGYSVVMRDRDGSSSVVIVDEQGAELAERICRDPAEARVYASTVRQHLYWLSPERFREYYQLSNA
jgi:hypothetical protein